MNAGRLELILSMLIFSTIGLVRRSIPCSSAFIALVRGVIGVAFLLLMHVLRREHFDLAALRSYLGKLAASGALIGLNWVFLFESYNYTTVSVATICYYMAPVFITLASPFVLGERLTRRQSLCCAAAVLGMVLVSGVLESGRGSLRGVLLALGAAMMYAAVVLLNKKTTGLPARDRTMVQLGFAALVVLPYVLLTGGFPAALAPKVIVLLLVAGILHTGFAYQLYFDSMTRLPAHTIAILSYIDPVGAVLISAFILGEPLSPLSALGIVIVLGATIISELHPGKQTPAPEKNT